MQNQEDIIFLSYAREDQDIAEKINKDLSSAGLHVWFDKESLLPGQKWKVEIKRAIRECRYFIALLSSKSLSKRGYVQKEVKEALDLLDEFPESEIFLIPVRIDECNPSRETLNELHRVDLFPSYEEGLKKILRAMHLNKFGATQVDSVDDGTIEGAIQIIDLSYYPESLEKGKDVFLSFTIINKTSHRSIEAWLGASLVDEFGREYFNVNQDVDVILQPGIRSYTRYLTIPAILTQGKYKIVGGVWLGKKSDVSNSRRIAVMDMGFRFDVR